MIGSLNALTKVLTKSLFKPPQVLTDETIASLKDIVIQESDFKVDYDHYYNYEFTMEWSGCFTHPCYLQMLTLPMQLQLLAHSKSPVKPVGLVHINNRIIQSQIFELGQPFDFLAKFVDVYSHSKGLIVEIELVAKQEGIEVYKSISTYLERSNPSLFTHLPQAKHLPYLTPCSGLHRRDLKIQTFLSNAGREYAALSKDFNPIHLSRVTAKLFGFRKPIVHGMCSLAKVLSSEEMALDFKRSPSPIEVDCDFIRPVFCASKTQIVTGCIGIDRFITLHDAEEIEKLHLLVRYARGEATRLHRQFR